MSHLEAIIDLIRINPVVSIIAPVGFGLSISIPYALAQSVGRCFISLPIYTSPQSLASYQIMYGGSDSISVGYGAGGTVTYTDETRIVYVTSGHLYRLMLGTPITFCDVILIDESRIGSLDTQLICALWVRANGAGIRVPKLVIISIAPIQIDIGQKNYIIESSLSNPEIKYEYKNHDIDNANGILYDEIAKLAAQIHKTISNDILIFVPGNTELDTVIYNLKRYSKAHIVSIHDTEPVEGQKIIVTVNIPEMLDSNIGYVIDSGAEHVYETSASGGLKSSIHYISKDLAKSRSECGPICHRMYTPDKYTQLQDHPIPDILRVPLYEVIMNFLDAGISLRDIIPDQRLSDSMQLLERLGMVHNGVVTEMGKFAPKVPLSVKNAACLWNWMKEGYPIFHGIIITSLIDCQGQSYFKIPRPKTKLSADEYTIHIEEFKSKYLSKFIGYSDLETCLKIWTDFMEFSYEWIININATSPQYRTLYTYAMNKHGSSDNHIELWKDYIRGDIIDEPSMTRWIKTNNLNERKIRELLTVVRQCIAQIGQLTDIGSLIVEEAINAVRPILAIIYSDTIVDHKKGIIYFDPVTQEDYRLNKRDNFNRLIENPPPSIIVLSTHEFTGQYGTLRIIKFGLDTAITPITTISHENELLISEALSLLDFDVKDAISMLRQLPKGVGSVPRLVIPEEISFRSSTEVVSMDRDYTRYLYINAMSKLADIRNWLLNLAYIKDGIDPIFSKDKMDVTHPVNLAFVSELNQMGIPNAGEIVGTCIAYALNFLSLDTMQQAGDPMIHGTYLEVGLYKGKVDKLLLNYGDITSIAKMYLRYACVPDMRQILVPIPINSLLINKYGFTVEGFATPSNSQFIRINRGLKFCSMFQDTDSIFGGLGRFTDQIFDNVKVFVNPPQVQNIIQDAVEHIAHTLDQSNNILFLVLVPKLPDMIYYQRLMTNPHIKHMIQLNPPDYYFVNQDNKSYKVDFPSTIFILSKGYSNQHYDGIGPDLITIYKMGPDPYLN